MTHKAAEFIKVCRDDGQTYAEIARKLRMTAAAVRGAAQRAGLVKPKLSKSLRGKIHVVIGDTQVKPGVPTAHLSWIGQYIAEKFVGLDVEINHLGDHWDMPSLSHYDVGKRVSEGRRYSSDVSSGNKAFRLLDEPIAQAQRATGWRPGKHFYRGNHEHRIWTACNDSSALDGKLSLDDLETEDWKVYDFRKPVTLDGVTYAHYFYNAKTGKPLGGDSIHARLKTIGHSFTMGHQQGLQYGLRPVGDTHHHGLVLGSTYLHDEDYLGPQVETYWRGIVVCYQVERGQYDAKFVSLDSLCRRYEGKTLAAFLRR